MKQRDLNKENILKYGIPENIVDVLLGHNYTVSKIRVASKEDLNFLQSDQIKIVKENIRRNPIPDDIFEQLVRDSELLCCFCWNIDDNKPIVIHHIEEYNISQNNKYDNLVVVCSNHHADIHTTRKISQDNFPPIKIIVQKEKWTQALKDYRNGNRVAPGKEVDKGVMVVDSPNTVVSINQTGGQTAQTIINQKPYARALNDIKIQKIQEQLKKYSPIPFVIKLSSGDAELEALANSIKIMLEGLNWENKSFEYNLLESYSDGLEIAIGKIVEPVHQELANSLVNLGNLKIRANKYTNIDILTFIIGPNPDKYMTE